MLRVCKSCDQLFVVVRTNQAKCGKSCPGKSRPTGGTTLKQDQAQARAAKKAKEKQKES